MTVLSCTTQEMPMPPPPAAADPPLTRAEFSALLARIDAIERRSVRTESKLSRLLAHHGLDGHGQPLNTEA